MAIAEEGEAKAAALWWDAAAGGRDQLFDELGVEFLDLCHHSSKWKVFGDATTPGFAEVYPHGVVCEQNLKLISQRDWI